MTTRYYVGFDVHKKTIVICVLDREGKVIRQETIHSRREALLEWIGQRRDPSRTRVALEASGSSAWVTYVLLAEGFDVVPVHPSHVRAIAETKRKSDRLDARKLAELLRAGVLRSVHIPSEDDRATRSLLRQMRRLVCAKTRAKSTVTSLLCELGQVCPWSDPFGKRGRAWLTRFDLAPEYRVIVEQQLAQIDLLEKQLKDLDKCLENALRASPLYELLQTIPGVGVRLGAAIALEFGDIRRFETPKAAACYTGLIPATFQSGEKRRGGRITKEGNSTLRWALVQAALQLVRLDAGAKQRYVKLRNRIKRSKARVAIARHLAVAIWHMAQTGEAYRASGAPKRPVKRRARAAST